MSSRHASTIWPVVHDERRALIGDLQDLNAGDWELASLCPGWDIHDVVAHLVDTAKTTRLSFNARLVASGFNFDRDNAVGVARERRATPQATLSAFHSVLSRTSSPPAPVATRLVEAYVHGEDIRRPLGIKREYPFLPVVAALKYQLGSSVKMGGGRERAKGLQLVASDTDFAHGTGLAVHGTAIVLLLAVSGRTVDAHELSGPGAAALLKG